MSYEWLHGPLLPIIRLALGDDWLPYGSVVLDVAGGSGEKLPLLREAYGEALLVGVDIDRAAAHAYGNGSSLAWGVGGDAHALPLGDQCCHRVICVAALGLFEQPDVALSEMWRVLKGDGQILLITSSQRWVETVPWHGAAQLALAKGYAAALDSGARPPTDGEIARELADRLATAGFAAPTVRAFALDADQAPLMQELALLPWASLRPLVAPHLLASHLTACDHQAALADVTLSTMVLLATATRAP